MGNNLHVAQTAMHLDTYLHEQIAGVATPEHCAFMMECTFGRDIHKKVDGFIQFALDEENDISEHDIKATLVHDLSGGLNKDELMIPRVDGYGDYSKLQ